MQTRLDIILETVSQILEGKKGRERGDEGSVRYAKRRRKQGDVERKQKGGYEGDRRTARDYADGPPSSNQEEVFMLGPDWTTYKL